MSSTSKFVLCEKVSAGTESSGRMRLSQAYLLPRLQTHWRSMESMFLSATLSGAGKRLPRLLLVPKRMARSSLWSTCRSLRTAAHHEAGLSLPEGARSVWPAGDIAEVVAWKDLGEGRTLVVIE